MGRDFRGIYDLREGVAHLYQSRDGSRQPEVKLVAGLASADLEAAIGAAAVAALREEVELVRGATPEFDRAAYLAGKQTPVFFGAAIHNYGVRELLDAFSTLAPPPQARATSTRVVAPDEPAFSGFVFKIQANMDPAHRDRIAFLRVCSGAYEPGMRMYHTRLGREVRVGDAITFMAADRQHVDEAFAGDIIGLHNHGTINIGDSFTQGESLTFTGIPSFAPELFRRAVLRDPLKLKALQKGLAQLCEEGATQLFRPLIGNDLILGAVGPLQFEVAAYRLRDEYGVEAVFESVGVVAARWVRCDDRAHLDEFSKKLIANVARDHAGQLVYLAPSTVSLSLTQERWPKIQFFTTRESSAAA
jgi:peptide chain release factor 3